MRMKTNRRALTALAIALPFSTLTNLMAQETSDFEVWAVDQAGTAGMLYIYDGETLIRDASIRPEIIDLTAAARLCEQQTGSTPTRGHMLEFDHSNSHAILAYVASGHVLFIDAKTRAAVACIDVGVQAHAAMPSPDGRLVVVANQNGKLLQRVRTDFHSNQFTLEPDATVNLATCTTPSGARCEDDGQTQTNVRPDNAPICPIFESSGRLVFVTLRGGGLLVVDPAATPMRIVAEYGRSTVRGNGCGGIETEGKMFINAGGGTAGTPTESSLYSFDLAAFQATNRPDTPAPQRVFSKQGANDGHGMVLARGGRFVWVADRMANAIEVVEAKTNTLLNTVQLSGAVSSDPAPDLLAMSPRGGYAFATLRGACPLTANTAANNAVGSTTGVGVISVDDIGLRARLLAVAPIVNPAPAAFDCPTRGDDSPGSITNQADVHGIGVRLK